MALSMLAALMVLSTMGISEPAAAQSSSQPRRDGFAPSRPTGVPLMAVVALNEQRVSIYDAKGKVLQAPVSTGQKGYETPAGIYSVLEKKREHYSNLYDDASMPFMQRLTWSGIALHAGVLPGYPASHGCIRMPHAFAKELFELTKVGLRVVVVRGDMSPMEIAHPGLFKPGPVRSDVALAMVTDRASDALASEPVQRAAHPSLADKAHTWRSIAAAKAVAAQAAAKKAEEARRTAAKAGSEAARFTRALRLAEGAQLRAEAQLQQVERALESQPSPAAARRFEELKAKALERLRIAQTQLEPMKAEGQPKIDAAEAAGVKARTLEMAKVAARNEAKAAAAKTAPVSVFISRKTQRVYVRQALQPVLESSLTIRDPDEPIGTTIFTALEYTNEGTDVRWSALSMYASAGNSEPSPSVDPRSRAKRDTAPAATSSEAAMAVLERITLPQEVIERINELVSPGSSLIVSDEVVSRETGKATDFVVLMSGEPQGGIMIRRRPPAASYRNDRARRGPRPSSNPFFWW